MKVILTAGGTGGHIYPAMAVAEELRHQNPDINILWVTTCRSNEADIAKRYGIDMLSLEVEGIQRRFSLQPVRAVVKLLRSMIYMNAFLKKNKVQAVIAFGGYVCAPVLFAARHNKIPYYIQEQNTVAGIVNKFFFKGAERVFLGMPLVGSAIISGTPTRKKSDYGNYVFPQEVKTGRRTVLICGGSQGAASMNKVLIKAVRWLSENGYQIVWQTGDAGEEEIKSEFAGDENVTVRAFLEDLYPYYSIAEILIGRSGAGTISEAKIFSLPAILIPLPWSAENHQWHNAGYAQDNGSAVRVEQNGETSDRVIEIIKSGRLKKLPPETGRNAAEIIVDILHNDANFALSSGRRQRN